MDTILEFIQERTWNVALLATIVALIIGMYCMKPKQKEGFQVPWHEADERIKMCPTLKLHLDNNNALLNVYNSKSAVTSARDTLKVIELFQAKYEEHDCGAYVAPEPSE